MNTYFDFPELSRTMQRTASNEIRVDLGSQFH